MFITSFLTTFIPTKTLYDQIWKNCVRYKNHQICEFGQLWRLPEGLQCKIGSLSLRYRLFKIPFLTTFISTKTLYFQIWNICQISKNFEFFESGKFWRSLRGERCILKGWSWRLMLFKITFLTTFISFIKLYVYDQIWHKYF